MENNPLEALPVPAEKRIAIHVHPAAEKALRGGHPWVYAESIRKQSHEGAPGDLAVIFDRKRRFIAIGLYDPGSPIRVRILQHREQATINRAWFTDKLRDAAAIRAPLLETETDGYRLLYGENDGLPGLVIDRYAETLVIKLYSAAWLAHLRDVVAALEAVQPFERLVLRLSRNMQDETAAYGLHDGQMLYGEMSPGTVVHFRENGLHFAADPVHGHKTGFFFDQRENRARVRDLAAGRKVLDVFAYSGGFSVYAAAGEAKSVTSLDISGPALDAAQANFALNAENPHFKNVRHITRVQDAFEGMADLHTAGEIYDMVIVDPPSMAKKTQEIERARVAYARLTRLALDLLAPGGVLVMASCSSHVTAGVFYDIVNDAASAAGRPLSEIARTQHALDHPIGFPEGAYLKCLFATAG